MTEGKQEVHIVLVSDEPTRVYPVFQLAMGVASIGPKGPDILHTKGVKHPEKR
jgi:peroxiredoxin family protein